MGSVIKPVFEDTVCAPATATGGAISVIRVSGTNAISICSEVCRRNLTNSITHTQVWNADGSVLDDVLVFLFRAPHSYTGEDCVEISTHGSSYITQTLLQVLIGKGCRMATAGEFTQRAFINGKMDLSQAEAVADLIQSSSRAAHRLAINQLRGGFSEGLRILRDKLLHLTSLLELELDFSDHEDLEFVDRTSLLQLSHDICTHITTLASTFHAGNALKNGIKVAIVGAPNVGKSSLLNLLLNEDKAIVSHMPGTTRDVIEDTIVIDGTLFRFVDTAGIRHTDDQVEQLGISRTYKQIEQADIVIEIVVNNSMPETAATSVIANGSDIQVPLIRLYNKSDLQSAEASYPLQDGIMFSTKTKQGLQELHSMLLAIANEQYASHSNDIVITNARHYQALTKAAESLTRVIQGMETNLPSDLVSQDLRHALHHLSDITGEVTTDEVLSNIFRNFCIGK